MSYRSSLRVVPRVVALVVPALLAHSPSVGGAQRGAGGAGRTQRVAFVGATVIPMDRDRAIPGQTVLVVDGTITAVGPAASVSTEGATIVDARGKYLIPGLVDAHTHMLMPSDAAMYVAGGVTTIFDLGSFDEEGLMAMRDSIRDRRLVGPAIYMAYFVDGPQTANGRRTITTPAAARAAVADAKRKGFEFIKAYNSIPESAAVALLDEATKQHVPVIGHGIRSLGLERGLALGQAAVAHAEEYIYAAMRPIDDPHEWERVAAFTRRSGAFVIPNLSAYHVIEQQWGRRPVLDSILRRPDVKDLAPLWQREWARGNYTSRPGSLDGRTTILRRLTKVLSDSGVPLMLGTDSPTIPGLFPGASALLDLEELVASGLTPYQALSAATRVPGEFLARWVPRAGRVGVIAPGYTADLILLDANPLDDVRRVARQRGVMIRGRWLTRADLDALVRCFPAHAFAAAECRGDSVAVDLPRTSHSLR